MTKDTMLRFLFGFGILLCFLCFLFLSIIADCYFYLETWVRVSVSLFVTGIGVSFRYLCLRIHKLETQVEDLMRRRVKEMND